MLQTVSDFDDFQNFLLGRNVDGHMRRHRISQNGWRGDFAYRAHGFGLNFFVQFYIFFELRNH